jgi:single-strand DNA-binding protein
MSSLNSFDFTGRLGGDPRLGTTSNGTDVCNFSCAIDTFGDRPTLWVDVAVWGQGAQPCERYLSKGSQVAIHGSVDEVASFEKRDGSTGFSLKVSTRDVSFIGGKGDNDSGGSDVPSDVPGGAATPSTSDTDDIPFACSAI